MIPRRGSNGLFRCLWLLRGNTIKPLATRYNFLKSRFQLIWISHFNTMLLLLYFNTILHLYSSCLSQGLALSCVVIVVSYKCKCITFPIFKAVKRAIPAFHSTNGNPPGVSQSYLTLTFKDIPKYHQADRVIFERRAI